MTAAAKIAALERLASDKGATAGERDNALRAAAALRARAPDSGLHDRPEASPPPRGGVESRGGVDYWVGEPPIHGRRCTGGGEGSSLGGCLDCARIETWRRWLRGGR